MNCQLISGLRVMIILAVIAAAVPAAAETGNCHMEKQCKWVNFKKVCVWTRVCR